MIPFYGFYILMVPFHRVLPQLQERKEHKLDMARITKVSPATNVYSQVFLKLSMFREFQEINLNLLSGSSNDLKLKKLLKKLSLKLSLKSCLKISLTVYQNKPKTFL